MKHSKKTREGRVERQQVLNAVFRQTDKVIDEALSNEDFRGRIGEDDILDALAAATTGLGDRNALRAIPDTRDFDAHGLPMEMVFRLIER